MNIKEIIKEIMKKSEFQCNPEKKEESVSEIDLNKKINTFINWYKDNMLEDHLKDEEKENCATKMRNFIEKMAVWYELRYPNYEIDKMMFSRNYIPTKVDEIMFEKNPYLNDLEIEKSDVSYLDWDKFYNTKSFIHSLPLKERDYFKRPSYDEIVNLKWCSCGHLHLSRNGYVKKADDIVFGERFKGKHISEVVKILKEKDLLPKDNCFEDAIANYNNEKYQKEEMLNCVMYRIIERGGSIYGPRRAFIFAKEFNKNIEIPMIYGLDCLKYEARCLVNEYLKAGGSKELECYENYFTKSKNEKIDVISVEKFMKDYNKSGKSIIYTSEEKELHKRLADVLYAHVDQDAIKSEEVNKLRLERKINKVKKN